MKKTKTVNWRTTSSGILAAVGTILTFVPLPWCQPVGMGMLAAGTLLTGVHATDRQVNTSQQNTLHSKEQAVLPFLPNP